MAVGCTFPKLNAEVQIRAIFWTCLLLSFLFHEGFAHLHDHANEDLTSDEDYYDIADEDYDLTSQGSGQSHADELLFGGPTIGRRSSFDGSRAVEDFLEWMRINGAEGVDAGHRKLEVAVRLDPELDDSWQSLNPHDSRKKTDPKVPERRPDYGLQAAVDLTPGESLFTIPRKLWVWEKEIAEREIVPYRGAPYDVVLAAWLLRERAKGKDSFWAPYIDVLPAQISLPVFWEEDEVAEIDVPSTIQKVRRMQARLKREFSRCDPQAMAGSSFAEFAWAMYVVTTRCFSVQLTQSSNAGSEGGIQGGDAAEAKPQTTEAILLLPLLDMGNHNAEAQAQWEEVVSGDGIRVTALAAVQAGAEVFTRYGDEDDEWFLTEYGFLPLENPHNSMTLFQSVTDVVHWYKASYAAANQEESRGLPEDSSAVTGGTLRSAEREAELAVRAVLQNGEYLKELAARYGVDYQTEEQQPLAIWGKAQVDPRLLAALAATCHVYTPTLDGSDVELDYAELAAQAVNLGWNIGDITCDKIDKVASVAVAEALRSAAIVVYDIMSTTLDNFKSTYQEDHDLLSKATPRQRQCKAEDEGSTRGGWCSDPPSIHMSQNRITAITYKMTKKALLINAGHRLGDACAIEPEEAAGVLASHGIDVPTVSIYEGQDMDEEEADIY